MMGEPSDQDLKAARDICFRADVGESVQQDILIKLIAADRAAAKAEGEAVGIERAAEVADKRAERSAANAQRYELKNTDAHTRACSRADEAESIADEIRALEAAAGSSEADDQNKVSSGG